MTALEIYRNHQSPGPGVKSTETLFDMPQLPAKVRKPSKYGNIYTEIDGILFSSKDEGKYYRSLKMRLNGGQIKGFKRQIPFEFVVNGIRIGKYISDFGVMNLDGRLEIVDVKSTFTVDIPLYKMKKQLMLALYQVAIKEVIYN